MTEIEAAASPRLPADETASPSAQLAELTDKLAAQLRAHPVAAVAAGVVIGLVLARVLRGR